MSERVLALSPHRFLLVTLVGAPLLLPAACRNEEAPRSGSMEREATAQEEAHLEEPRPEAASIELRRALARDPDDPEAHYRLARVYLELGKTTEATGELRETLRLDPDNLDARRELGQLAMAAEDFEDALAQADASLAREPDSAPAHLLRAQALEKLERFEEAGVEYRKATQADPDKFFYRVVRSAFHERRKAAKEEKEKLQRAGEGPGDRSAQAAVERLLATERLTDDAGDAEAIATLFEALKNATGPERVGAYARLASFLFGREHLDEAVEVLEEGVANSRNDPGLLFLLARLHAARGHREVADGVMGKVTGLRPDDPESHLLLADYRSRNGDYPGALEAVDAALALSTGHRGARLRKAELLMDRALRDRDQARFAQGRKILASILEDRPSPPEVILVRGKAELAEGDVEAAVASERSVVHARPDWAPARFAFASALVRQGSLRAAHSELTRALELDPGLVDAHRLLAQVHAKLGDTEDAAERGRLFLRARPEDLATRILTAESLVALGRHDEALELLAQVPEQERDAQVQFAFGRLHALRGEFEEASAALRQADAIEPNSAAVLQNLLDVDRKLGRRDAQERIRRAVAAKPGDPKLQVLRGHVALLEKDPKAAERSYRRATELASDDLSALGHLSALLRSQGRVDEAIATYRKALKAHPDAAMLHEGIALHYELTGDAEKAIAHYERAIAANPHLFASLNNLANLLAERDGDLDRALQVARKAKGLMSDSPQAADTMGWVLLKRGKPEAAMGYLREAEAGLVDSDNPRVLGTIRYHMALAHEAMDQAGDAILALERALADLEGAPEPGADVQEPEWAGEARSMLGRLRANERDALPARGR